MKTPHLIVILFIAVSTSFAALAQTEPDEAWEPQVAGRFYPGSENALRDQISSFFKNVPRHALKGKPIALISPHAGYQYSGQVAAYGYHAIKEGGFTRVIILSPSHFRSGKRFRGASVLNVKNFKTPLGLIPVDQGACNQLIETANDVPPNASHKTALFGTYEGAYEGEHSLETQLPFLQASLKNFTVVPLMIGILIDDDFERIAGALRPLMNDKTLVVVSSDFTHYGEGYGYVPFRKEIEKNIKALDYGVFERILNKDFEGLKTYRKETGINVCGIMPLELLLKLLPGNASGEILSYDTSGRQSGDFSFSVSYASILFTKPAEDKSGLHIPKGKTPDKQHFLLTGEEKTLLLSLARNTLETYTKTGVFPKVDYRDDKLTWRLKEKYGVFVTLKKHGKLRGCTGHIMPRTSLIQGVVETTIHSSSNDRRFNPVNAGEVSDITIEISVLSHPEKIPGPEKFMVGKEGIIIRKGPASAIFLPQVAAEQGWDKTETLRHLCQKAGLSTDEWKGDGMEFYIFTADIFREGEKS